MRRTAAILALAAMGAAGCGGAIARVEVAISRGAGRKRCRFVARRQADPLPPLHEAGLPRRDPSHGTRATTADAFNAVAEPRRRQILDVLAGGEHAVNDLVRQLGLAQPQVSKHLRVLREVGAVEVRDEGRQRLYPSRFRSAAATSEANVSALPRA
jgi:DNA-binding transcriptional ArsR family regulator